MKTVVSERGQVTIPKKLRMRLGIRHGDVLDFEEENGRLVASRVTTTTDPVDALYGIIETDKGMSVDEFLDAARGYAKP